MPADEDLEIDGLSLLTPAWVVTDLTPVWEGAEVRGADRLLPGSVGVRSYQRRRTVTRKALPMVIFGEKDQAGASHADPRVGLWTNLAYLQTNVVDPGPPSVTTTAASTTITAVGGSFRPSDVGKAIIGTGIPAGTTITAVASATSATMSAAATATGTVGVTLRGDGTRTATLYAPGTATRSGSVHVLGLAVVRLGPIAFRGVLTLSIPGGALL